VYSRTSGATPPGSLFQDESQAHDTPSIKSLYDSFRQTVEDAATQVRLVHLSATNPFIMYQIAITFKC